MYTVHSKPGERHDLESLLPQKPAWRVEPYQQPSSIWSMAFKPVPLPKNYKNWVLGKWWRGERAHHQKLGQSWSRAGKGNSTGGAEEETRANKDVEDAGWWSRSMGRKKHGLAVARGFYKQEMRLSCIPTTVSISAFSSSRIEFTDWGVCMEELHKQFQPPENKSSSGNSAGTAVSS